MNNRNITYILLLCLALIAGVYIVMNLESYEEEKIVEETREARQKPFLASQRLLEKSGVKSSFEDDYRRLFSNSNTGIVPSLSDTVILTDAEAAVSEAVASELLDWVEEGGFLILSVNITDSEDSHRANAITQKLNVGAEWRTDDEFEQKPSSMKDPDGNPIKVNLEAGYFISIADDIEPFYSVRNDGGYTFLQLKRGDGLITLMTEVEIWNNWQLADDDNAILLLGLLENSDTVYFFDPQELPHWFTLLYSHAPLFVVSLVVLIFLSIWYAGIRFGSISHGQSANSLRFSEHIRVAGDYYWKQGKQGNMLSTVRSLIMHNVLVKWPSLTYADEQKIVQLLEELSGWPKDVIHSIMYDQSELNQSQFSQRMKELQQLRKML